MSTASCNSLSEPPSAPSTINGGEESRTRSVASKDETQAVSAEQVVPDGGLRAMTVVLGSSVAMFSSFGIINAFGAFQNYYSLHLLSESSSSTISLIGAIQLFLLYGLGPIMGRIFDVHGTRILLPAGTVITVLSLILTSFCQEGQVYQFFLVQGIMFGVGSACIFHPAFAVLGQWFRRNRSLAMSVAGAGASGGGVVYPILLEKLITRVGFSWAVRIIALVALAGLLLACMTIETRHSTRRSIAFRDIVDIDGFRDVQYCLAACGSFLYFFALFIPYFYIQLYAEFKGVDPSIAQYLLTIINALGIPARIVPGLLADRFGILEILVPCTLVSGISVLGLWLPARTTAGIIAFSVMYGLFSGAFVSLLPAYVASRSPVNKIGARLGSIYIFVAFGNLVGTPTAGAFVPAFTNAHFDKLIIFTGFLILAGGMLLGLACTLTRRSERIADSASSIPVGA